MSRYGIRGRNELNFSWLVKLRWSSIVGQIFTVLGVTLVLDVPVPLLPLAIIIGLEAASNVAASVWFHRISPRSRVFEWHLAAVMALDIGLLTGLLYFTGGADNPFSFLYLVNIALAAVMVHAQWTWALVALSLFSFGLLPVLDHWPLPLDHLAPGELVGVRQQGMWVAFGVAAGFIVHFLWRVTGALAQREAELTEARARGARQERMASLATMAAGAAHELATPLGTIALVAKELERGLASSDASTLEDIALIREQVGRCRTILDQMAGSAGKSGEDAIETITVEELIRTAMTGVRRSPPVDQLVSDEASQTSIAIPPRALAQAVRNLVTNAQDACPTGSVALRATLEAGADPRVAIEVADQGAGMSGEVLARCGEPFFTTKQPGAGMGLGLFLTRAVIEGLGGQLEIDSQPTIGTSARVTIPLNPSTRAGHPTENHAL